MVTAGRWCAECGAEFIWTSRTPTRRFCGSRCKARWWRAHHSRADTPAQDHHRPPMPPRGTYHECPNCGQHITVLNLIVADDSGSG